MPERCGDVQRFGPQAFETWSLWRLIGAGFHFTYGPTEFLCAHTDRELSRPNGPTEGFQFATRITTCFALNGHTIGKTGSRNGQWTMAYFVVCMMFLMHDKLTKYFFVCFENRNC